MSNTYYYLVASLPALAFAAPGEMSCDAFVALCGEHLSVADHAELTALLAGRYDEVRTEFSRGWLDADRQVRNASVRARALRLGVDEKRFLREHRGFRVAAETAVNEAFARAHPLDRELALDRFRWNLADEWSLGEPFSLEAVLAYGMRLAINERWRGLTPERGRERFDEMVDVVGVSSQEVSAWSGLSQV